MKSLLAILICIVIGLLLWKPESKDDRLDADISHKINIALQQLPDTDEILKNDNSFIEDLTGSTSRRLTERQIQDYLKNLTKKKRAGVWFWWLQNRKIIAASAFGTDNNHHFVSGYLVGYAPFETALPWVPHYTVAMRLRYQMDSTQYGGLQDVWQNSRQAFFNTRGDCEDHALVIADWLIEMGVDARVVLGKFKKSEHAWVIVLMDDQVFLLEATDKLKRKHWRHYPLADLASGYYPKYMFNREYFWVNTASELTTDYTGRHWEMRSRFFLSD